MTPTQKRQRFENLVAESGRTVRELASELDVSRGYISDRLSGRREVRRLDLLALRRLLEP
jgi:transcriptional regulator with XRE-family HTH domain